MLVTPPPKSHKWVAVPAEIEVLLEKVKFGLQALMDVVLIETVGDGAMIKELVKLAGQLWSLRAFRVTV